MIEKIYYNGTIITMEEDANVEAVLVCDGIIKCKGNASDILNLKNKDTEIIDLQGKTLMPSFIDPHSHLTAFASTLALVQLDGCKSFDDIVSRIKDFKRKNRLNDDEWIIGFGYDNNALKEKANPTKDILDKASKTNPILVTHKSGHMGVVNSIALEKLDITSECENPEGGVIGRVEDSDEPNGYLEENAFMSSARKVPQPGIESIAKAIENAQDIYLSYGITTAQEGLINESEMNLLKYMVSKGPLKLDVIGYVDLKNSKSLMENNKSLVNNYYNNFKIGGYKIFLDGSPQGKTAWLTEPYVTSPDGYRGYPIYKDEEVKELIKLSLDEEMQLLTHCNGDAAADQLIDLFDDILECNNYDSTNRPVMIHAQTVRYDQIDKMKKIGMMPSYFVAHTYFWGDTHIKNLAMERASRISPAKTTLEKGVPFTFHQDTPVILPDMLFTVWCAVNRITANGVSIGSSERISPLEALKAITINAAYQYFEEDIKGSIKEGKQANFVILDKNPLIVDPMEIKDIKVLKTIKKGEVLFELNK